MAQLIVSSVFDEKYFINNFQILFFGTVRTRPVWAY